MSWGYVYDEKAEKGYITRGGGWFAWLAYDSEGLQTGYSKAHLEACDEEGYSLDATLCGVPLNGRNDTQDPDSSCNCARCEKISERLVEGDGT